MDIINEQTDGLLNELKLFRDRVDSGNLFQTDGAQQLKAWQPNNASRFWLRERRDRVG